MRRLEIELSGFSGRTPIPLRSVAPGVFDALHLGHRALVERLVGAPGSGECAILTFSRHPREFLGGAVPARVLDPRLRDRLFEEWGVDLLVTIRTDAALLALEAEEFLRRLHSWILPRVYVAGPDFRFGRGRAGSLETIRASGVAEVMTLGPVSLSGERLSATAVRSHLANGRVREAAALLGREYTVIGSRESGDGIGRKLAAPTVNLEPPPEALVDGIYAVRTPYGDGVAHLGPRPAVGSDERRFEVHVLDREVAGDANPREWEVSFVERIRGVEDFPTREELKAAIARDIVRAREIFGAGARSGSN